MYTDKMYQVAMNILQNREDQLMHAIDNTELLKKKDRMMQQSKWERNKRTKKYDPKAGIAYNRYDRHELDAELGKHGYVDTDSGRIVRMSGGGYYNKTDSAAATEKFLKLLDKNITDEQIRSMFKNGADRKEIAEIIFDRMYKEYGYNPTNLPSKTEQWIDEKITRAIKK